MAFASATSSALAAMIAGAARRSMAAARVSARARVSGAASIAARWAARALRPMSAIRAGMSPSGDRMRMACSMRGFYPIVSAMSSLWIISAWPGWPSAASMSFEGLPITRRASAAS